MKFLVDMPLSPALAEWLCSLGHDAVHATQLGMHQATDAEILSSAASGGQTIVTADLDYPQLLALARATEPSVILFRDGACSDSDVIDRMSDVLDALQPADIASSIIVVERARIRRRRLPLS